jgi:hypothetical protein
MHRVEEQVARATEQLRAAQSQAQSAPGARH